MCDGGFIGAVVAALSPPSIVKSIVLFLPIQSLRTGLAILRDCYPDT